MSLNDNDANKEEFATPNFSEAIHIRALKGTRDKARTIDTLSKIEECKN